ncbi:MAG: hypothetical protein OXT65_11655 [Alphaproteobacteria bacterium]|nr:hypothetical protein [Alphaproteobacteria bacterium]
MGRKKQEQQAEEQARQRQEFCTFMKEKIAGIEKIESFVEKYEAILDLQLHVSRQSLIANANDQKDIHKTSSIVDRTADGVGTALFLGGVGTLMFTPIIPMAIPVALFVGAPVLEIAGRKTAKRMWQKEKKKALPSQDWLDTLGVYSRALQNMQKNILENHMADLAADKNAGRLLERYPALHTEFSKAFMKAQQDKGVTKIVSLPKPKPPSSG